MRKYISIILSMLLLCGCQSNNIEQVSESAESIVETTVTTAVNEYIPEAINEINVDIDLDGNEERLVLHPDAENENSIIYCYSSDGGFWGSFAKRIISSS